MKSYRRIVVVGAGVAGLRAAERLRELGFDGELTMIGSEPRRPYHRPEVSKHMLFGGARARDLTLQAHGELDARWRLGAPAISLDTDRRLVHLAGEEKLPYDGLVIATGMVPRHLAGAPRHDPRVHVLHTVADALAIKRTITSSTLPVVVLGTGFLGCDVAASARQMGRDVTMVGRSGGGPLKMLGPQVSDAVSELHGGHRVRFALGVDVLSWKTTPEAVELHLSDGRVLVSGCVVLAIGSVPAVDWLRGAGLVTDGVLCGATLFAEGAADVVVAGDVGCWPNLRFDAVPRRVEHWINAVEMSRAAAENLLVGRARARPFTPVPRVWSGQYGVRLQLAGMPSLGTDTVRLAEGTTGTPGVIGYIRSGRLVGVFGWDSPRAMLKWTAELHRRLPVPRRPATRVARQGAVS